MKKEMIVIVENINGRFYLGKNLEFEDGLCDNCIWNEDIDTVKEIAEKDAKLRDYKIVAIEEF